METTLYDEKLKKHAAGVFSTGYAFASPDKPFYDPSLPLPRPRRLSRKLPTLPKLFKVIPDYYARLIETAYVQMNNFSDIFCPQMNGIIHAEPFFEWMMHMDILNPHYRDHIVHQARVAAIGDILLDQKIDRVPLKERVADILGKKSEFVRIAWWLAALFHDCGYPCQFHNNYFQEIKKAYDVSMGGSASASRRSSQRDVATFVGPLTSGDIENCNVGKHSFTGAAELAALERKYENGPGKGENRRIRKRRRGVFQLAISAILTHHGPASDEKPIRFSESPLNFLLILSDELHEGKRPLTTANALNFVSGRRGGKTIIRYQDGDIISSKLRIRKSPSGANNLELIFRPRKGLTEVRGRLKEEWAEKKESDLNKLLGSDAVFGRVKVSVA